MDEFAFGPKEIELLETKNSSDTSLQDVLNLLNNGKLEVDYIIESVDEELTSVQKWVWALGAESWAELDNGARFWMVLLIMGMIFLVITCIVFVYLSWAALSCLDWNCSN